MSDDTVTQNPQDTAAPMLTLVANVDPNGTTAATLPIRWQPSPQLIEEIKQRRFKDPHLVIVTRAARQEWYSSDYSETVYEQTGLQIVPLRKEMAFVTFVRPGANEVRVAVVDMADASAWRAMRDEPVFNNHSSRFNKWQVSVIEESITTLETNVPPEFFAKELPMWLNRFLGNFFERRPTDQCHNRRRMILAFGLFAPLSLTVALALRLLVGLVSLLLFPREMEWKGFLPFNYNDLPVGKGGSRWYTRPKKYGGATADPARLPLWVCNPLTLVIVPIAVFAVGNIREHHGHSQGRYPLLDWGFWHTVWIVDQLLVGVGVVFCIQVALVLVIALAVGRITGKHEARALRRRITRAERKQQEVQERTQQMLADLAEMTRPSPDNLVPDISALPRDKQTISLRFAALKAQVCRPFAR